MSLDTPTIIKWSRRFPLQDALVDSETNPVPKNIGGIYLWGFDACGKEIIWYVGKGILRSRLWNHDYHLRKGHHQIPKGFLHGGFKSLADVDSGWERNLKDPRVIKRLQDWNQMQELIRAGHAFASQAFARIAPISGKLDKELYEIERAIIYDLQPFINKLHKKTLNYLEVTHELSPTEHDWLQGWHVTKSLVEQAIQTDARRKVTPVIKVRKPIPPEPVPPEPPLTAAQLDELRRRLISVLNKLDSSPHQHEKGKLAQRIERLKREGKIPRDVAACMMSITEARNLVVFEEKTLTPAQSAAVIAAWEAVKEWATSKGIKISE